MPDRPSEEQVSRVLRRAIELERRRAGDEHVPDVEEIAHELGLERATVRRALAESETGALEEHAEPTFLDRVIGDHVRVVERTVPLSAGVAETAIRGFLEGQLFRLARRQGARTLWRSDASLIAQVRRTFDLTDRYELPDGAQIEAHVAPEDEGARVRLVLRLDAPQKRRARSLAGLLVVAGGIIAAGTALAHTAVADALMVAAGGTTALAGWGGIRGRHRKSLTEGGEALERLLDRLA